MKKNLVIVESPAKAKTIVKFLGKNYQVKASLGHVRDLPSYKLGVDINNNFAPYYSNLRDKSKIIKELKEITEKVENVLIATDPDREGEAIAWHIKESIKIPDEKVKRIVFHEITKSAILSAIDHSRDIDFNLVDAQQARRVLDRLIGYKLSPILGKKIRKGLSAGRVQSVALKMVCDREREIKAFVPKEYWVIDLTLSKTGDTHTFNAKVFALDNEKNKLEIANKEEADKIFKHLKKAQYLVSNIKTNVVQRQPQPPLITSTLQQEASKRFNWTTKKTMLIAQQLYEGIEIEGEFLGLITYMRTDSFRISDEAKIIAKEIINEKYGEKYLPKQPRVFKSKKNTQDAHEAIRPTYVNKGPKELEGKISADQFKLYSLIWQRFIASQMEAASVENKQIIIAAEQTGNSEKYLLKATGNTVLFDGFTRLSKDLKEKNDEDFSEANLPVLTEKDELLAEKIKPEQKFTQPPARFSEASLIRELEEKGIGRPSTYAPTLSLIQDRGYVEKEKRNLFPTELGLLIDEQLAKYFGEIIDYDFTATLENKLDEIMDGKHVWQSVISEFYKPFESLLATAEKEMENLKKDKPSDEICELCGKNMVIKAGRFGDFLACSDYPNCKNTKSILKELNVACPECGKPIIEKKTRKGKKFYGCSGYPDCKYALWDMPLAEKCDKCNHPIMLLKTIRGKGKAKVCPNCDNKITDQSEE